MDPLKRVFPAEAVEEAHRSAEPATTMDRWIEAMIAQAPLAQDGRGVALEYYVHGMKRTLIVEPPSEAA